MRRPLIFAALFLAATGFEPAVAVESQDAETPAPAVIMSAHPKVTPWRAPPEVDPADLPAPVAAHPPGSDRPSDLVQDYRFQPAEGGHDLEAVMRRLYGTAAECSFRFDVTNHSAKRYESLTLDLVVMQGVKPYPSDEIIVMHELVSGEHVRRELRVPLPCDSITALRLIETPLCVVDGAQQGNCGNRILMRSIDRVRFGS